MKPWFIPFVCLALAVGATGAAAATYEERVVKQLHDLGYTDVTVNFTLLGRAQIIATGKADTREIVLNPRTGEILRDYAQTLETSAAPAVPIAMEPIVLEPVPEVGAVVPLELAPLDAVPVEAAPPFVAVDPASVTLDTALGGFAETTAPSSVNPGSLETASPVESPATSGTAATAGGSPDASDPGAAP